MEQACGEPASDSSSDGANGSGGSGSNDGKGSGEESKPSIPRGPHNPQIPPCVVVMLVENIPEGAKRSSYQDHIIKIVIFQVDIICYRREVWCARLALPCSHNCATQWVCAMTPAHGMRAGFLVAGQVLTPG